MQHLFPADYRAMPWKDGGGSTLEIAIEPPGANLSEPFSWRVSSARVEASGPFSRFPGYERALVLLEGSGFILDRESQPRLRLKQFSRPVFFSGDEILQATLIQGPSVDFGVISNPSKVKTSLQALVLGPEAISLSLAPTTLLFAPRGGVIVDPKKWTLGPMETLRLSSEGAEKGLRLGLRGSVPDTPLIFVGFSPI